jgi:hypothetical protein
VTLLPADVEGSTRLWETQPYEMTVAVARLDQVLSDVVAAHDGVRPVEQGEGATPAPHVSTPGRYDPGPPRRSRCPARDVSFRRSSMMRPNS